MQLRQVEFNRWTILLIAVLGFFVSVACGLLLGWFVWPASRLDADVANLRADLKEQYIVLVASGYVQDDDLEEAKSRLAQLEAPNVNQWVADLAERYIAEGLDQDDIQALVVLSHALGVDSRAMSAYLVTPTPVPTDTPVPSPTPTPTTTPLPTSTPIPPTDTATPIPPTDTPAPSSTPVPEPTATSIPPTSTPKPKPTNTRKPPTPTNTPEPAAPLWAYNAWLVGPGHDAQTCEAGNLQIRVMVLDAGGSQLPGMWVYDYYSKQFQVTGNVDSPDWGPGETKFEYGGFGGGRLCIAEGEGGACVSDYTRDMPVYEPPPFEDMWAAGYCECCEIGMTRERCQALYDAREWCMAWRHYSWRIEFRRSR
jgi:hypothetical protein